MTILVADCDGPPKSYKLSFATKIEFFLLILYNTIFSYNINNTERDKFVFNGPMYSSGCDTPTELFLCEHSNGLILHVKSPPILLV